MSQKTSRIITSEIVVAYSQCPRKAYLLLCTRERGIRHEYIGILKRQREVTQRKHLAILQQKYVDVQSYSPAILAGKHAFLINATLEANGLVAECAILRKVRTHSVLGRYSYEPTILVGTYGIRKEQKLELFFVSYVLEQMQGKHPVSGRIIGLDEKSHKVKLDNGNKTLIPFLEPLQEWAEDALPESPPLILNKQCPICQFENLCRNKAKKDDNLSLLASISTQKAINRYEKKGLFTVKQLSYTFKPRKRKKRTRNPPPVVHKPELQALAIRERKIYLQELPKLPRHSVELFLDIEGIPDQNFYYLLGLLVCESESITYYSFWANTVEDEAQMWQEFLAKVRQYPDAPIYHYGSFDSRTLGKLAKRYNNETDSLNQRLVNVSKYVFGKVYFPVYSNRLKEIGAFIGATWSSPNASGLQALVWWHYWDETHHTEYKDLLLIYNKEDCQALKQLTDELSRIQYSADEMSEVEFTHKPKQQTTEVSQEIHSQFKEVLRFAHYYYDIKKINFRSDEKKVNEEERIEKYRDGARKMRQKFASTKHKVRKIVQVPIIETCPQCGSSPLIPTNRVSRRLIIDLVTTKNGVKKTVAEYVGTRGFCSTCQKSFFSPTKGRHSGSQLYGHGFHSWVVFHRIALRLPYESIRESLREHFDERISIGQLPKLIRNSANYYAQTKESIKNNLLQSAFIHVDETKISIRGVDWYVWVFTNEEYVNLELSETRESVTVHKFLDGYEGVLVSDFYPGYDSINCRQQKCWVHLIRDLNNDLQKNPFDKEFESFIVEVRNLIIPIMEDVHKYGLKRWNLYKFKKLVDRFYKNTITDKRYSSELTTKYQKRFIRYRDSLFTFLEQDKIPWNNNTAERGIRPIAKQRAISGSFGEGIMRSYLVLLGIRQTCRFQSKSFFKFLFSGETDIDRFEIRKRRQRMQ